MPLTRIPQTAPLNRGVGQTPGTTTVTDSSTQIVASNRARSSVFLINTDVDDVWVAVDATAILDTGILLSRNGGGALLDGTALSTGPINGIVASGKTADVTFQELNT